MTEEINILDFNQAINTLNDVSNAFTVDAYVPSKNNTLTFKEINAKQQKELLGAAMDTSVYNLGFSNAFYNILKDNLIHDEGNDVIDTLTISDKACIALQLKGQISNELKIVFDEKSEVIGIINVEDVINKFRTYQTPQNVILDLINDKVTLKAEVRYPNLKIELDYDTEFKKNKKTEDIKTNQDVQNIITAAFIGETSKYISKIWINDSEVDFDSMSFKQRVGVVEKLPSGLLQKILEKISSWKKELDEVLTVTQDDYKKTISIDSLLFLN
jgi:hypothetical protein